jgi:hypothetical protein
MSTARARALDVPAGASDGTPSLGVEMADVAFTGIPLRNLLIVVFSHHAAGQDHSSIFTKRIVNISVRPPADRFGVQVRKMFILV